MAYYTRCETCGAHLDPGERCDCELTDKKEKSRSAGTETAVKKKARTKAYTFSIRSENENVKKNFKERT